MALIGAAALGCHIPMKWRRTEDLDLVVALSIEDASRILASLEGWSENRHKEHEWFSPQHVRIDLIPISDQALACGVLVWPRAGTQMSLLGMQHALASQSIEISSGLTLALPPVPIIALLKMASYLDRPFERERDLSDLAHILEMLHGRNLSLNMLSPGSMHWSLALGQGKTLSLTPQNKKAQVS